MILALRPTLNATIASAEVLSEIVRDCMIGNDADPLEIEKMTEIAQACAYAATIAGTCAELFAPTEERIDE
ncbi:MAG: hypothetical protein A2V88_04330 [Elusimicrobia bacterium RBG_16_66_12]|nr:MAG: hypothetical protein A2V88_04330 [Elusimicrobia bacterium RBG_16_66_12]